MQGRGIWSRLNEQPALTSTLHVTGHVWRQMNKSKSMKFAHGVPCMGQLGRAWMELNTEPVACINCTEINPPTLFHVIVYFLAVSKFCFICNS